jgi:ABC-2 type transport system ATP-binding protein
MSDLSSAVPVTETAVVVRGLEKSYGAQQVLRGVDFEVRRGEVFCLLGPNGAGKTTTVEILEGFRDRTGGIVLQECGFPRQARVGELIDIWRDYYPNPRPLEDLLEVVELSADRGTPVRKLSGGQRRRLDFALALAGDPDLVFLDEPTTGFDPEARRRCWAAIENLRGLGKTVLLTTHYLDEAERLADRVAILLDGRIEVAGPTRDVARGAGLATRVSFGIPDALRYGQVPPPVGLELDLNGTTAVCHTRNSAAALRALLDWAYEYGVGELDDLSVAAPSLEEAYLHLVEHNGDPGR